MSNEFTLTDTDIISEALIVKDKTNPIASGTRISTIIYPKPILCTNDRVVIYSTPKGDDLP